ncbi:hypothetical protein LCGC14_0463880 [marine sediment metagenome]|uniref:Uncharacterized protein n=1 Tax=marine sediment metagenome TaxID=412755 RepID=A0A0F9SEB2_9ZZZZ
MKPQIIIELDEFNRFVEMEKAFKENKLWIEHDSYFTGGPGGRTRHGIVIYSKNGIDDNEIKNFNKELAVWQEKTYKLSSELYSLKKTLKKKNKSIFN